MSSPLNSVHNDNYHRLTAMETLYGSLSADNENVFGTANEIDIFVRDYEMW